MRTLVLGALVTMGITLTLEGFSLISCYYGTGNKRKMSTFGQMAKKAWWIIALFASAFIKLREEPFPTIVILKVFCRWPKVAGFLVLDYISALPKQNYLCSKMVDGSIRSTHCFAPPTMKGFHLAPSFKTAIWPNQAYKPLISLLLQHR